MPSSISSSEPHHPASAERPTASDRPGVAQPVPERPVPAKPWAGIALVAALLFLALTALWEWRMRALSLEAGDLSDGASAWAEQRRRIDAGDVQVAILGDSRILFDTDLAHFEALTGVRPVQLALAGTNARPFLAELAADPDFRGLAIVGIADTSYFRDEPGRGVDALERYRYESPSQRSGYLLQRLLSRALAFLDPEYRLSTLVHRLDRDTRPMAQSPLHDVWKIRTSHDARQSWMWTRLEHDARLRDQARAVWMRPRAGAKPGPVATDVIARTQAITRKAVASIRARGGEVVFVRAPSAPQVRVREDKRIPRSLGWDPLLAAADVRGVHFDDYPSMQGLDLPEWSHLSRRCATVFTDAYVRELARLTGRLTLRATMPPLTPEDCRATDSAMRSTTP